VDISLLDLALIVGFTARLIRLAAVDTAGEPFRAAIRWAGRWIGGTEGYVRAQELVTCPFCIGFWLSGAVVLSYVAAGGHGWRTVAAIFTLSYVAGHLVRVLDFGDDDD
jgi:hypothetical protein